jgi:hypothetical protein
VHSIHTTSLLDDTSLFTVLRHVFDFLFTEGTSDEAARSDSSDLNGDLAERVNNLISDLQRRRTRTPREAKRPFTFQYQNGVTALSLIQQYLHESPDDSCHQDLHAYFDFDKARTLKKNQIEVKSQKSSPTKENSAEVTPVGKLDKTIAWIVRWRGPQVFYHTKVILLRFLEALNSCSDFNITLVSLLDIGANSNAASNYMNPWAIWVPKSKRIGKHLTLEHFVLSNNSTLFLLGPKSKDLFRTKGGSVVFHDIHVLQWWLSLSEGMRETYQSVWIVEDDTFYNGDLCDFLQKYLAKKWDYLSTPTSSAVDWPHKEVRTHQFPTTCTSVRWITSSECRDAFSI